jgi:hypothetical protein
MNNLKNKALWLFAAFAILANSSAVFAQSTKTNTKPLVQDIVVKQSNTNPTPTATPFVAKTGSSASTTVSSRKTSIPALMNVDIPGYSGILVESPEGNIVLESGFENFRTELSFPDRCLDGRTIRRGDRHDLRQLIHFGTRPDV